MQFHWPRASVPPDLGSDAHVWAVHLELSEEKLRSFEAVLSTDERARARAFRIEGLGPRFIAAHGALRTILGRYLNVAPEGLAFEFEHRGKPCIADGRSGGRLKFNLSHSG